MFWKKNLKHSWVPLFWSCTLRKSKIIPSLACFGTNQGHQMATAPSQAEHPSILQTNLCFTALVSGSRSIKKHKKHAHKTHRVSRFLRAPIFGFQRHTRIDELSRIDALGSKDVPLCLFPFEGAGAQG